MKINQSNYEEFFIDYLDNILPDNEMNEFIDFMVAHPELKEELRQVSKIRLTAPPVCFSDKNSLMHKESDIGIAKSQSLDTKLEQLDKLPDIHLYPDLSVTYDRKDQLIHHPSFKRRKKISISLISFLVLALLWIGINHTGTNNQSPTVVDRYSVRTDLAKLSMLSSINTGLLKTKSDDPDYSRQLTIDIKKPAIVPKDSISEPNLALEPIPAKLNAVKLLASANLNAGQELIVSDFQTKENNPTKIKINNVLNLFQTVSPRHFRYQTDQTGKIKAIHFQSRLITVSLPLNKN